MIKPQETWLLVRVNCLPTAGCLMTQFQRGKAWSQLLYYFTHSEICHGFILLCVFLYISCFWCKIHSSRFSSLLSFRSPHFVSLIFFPPTLEHMLFLVPFLFYALSIHPPHLSCPACFLSPSFTLLVAAPLSLWLIPCSILSRLDSASKVKSIPKAILL